MLNDLLDLARIEAGQLAIVTAPLDPIGLTRRLVALVRPEALARGLSLEDCRPDRLPAGLAGDEIRLQQVLLNLLTNALKFTPAGAVRVRLLNLPTASGAVRLRWEVSDTGIGIAADQLQRIFDPFTQVAEPVWRKGGAGLGLAICKRLVALMSGEMGVESRLGAGSTFWFEIPLAKSPAGETGDPPAAHPQRSLHPLRVLVVDDDPVNRKLLAQLVTALGHQAVAACGGEVALLSFSELPFDAAILDWQMPDMNGGELARRIRALERMFQRERTLLIALSAALEPGSDRATDFDGWLSKPIGQEQLSAVLRLAKKPADHRPDNANRWTPVLDRLGGRHDLLAALARNYCQGLPALLGELRAAAAQHRMADVARLAHLLAGQGSNFDAPALVSAARSLEEATLTNVLTPAVVGGLETKCQRLSAELDLWLAEPSLAPSTAPYAVWPKR